MTVLLVALAAGFGTAVRFVVAARMAGRRATLAVNVLGCGLLGLLASSSEVLALLALGFAGGLTTFSTWAVETVEGGGVRYAAATTALCLTATAAGLGVAQLVTG